MCYTSGTTGRPKGVVYSHRSMVLHTLVGDLPDSLDLAAKDSVLPVTPMFHANCWGLPFGAAMMGIKLIFPGPHLGAADLIDLFMREQPTYSRGVPTIWIAILQRSTRSRSVGAAAWRAHDRRRLGGARIADPRLRRDTA